MVLLWRAGARPGSGQIVGLVDLSSLWKIAHPRSLELVSAAARSMERCLLDNRRDRDARARRRYSDLMTRSTDLLVDREGYVLDGDEPRQPVPIQVPKDGGEVILDDGLLSSLSRWVTARRISCVDTVLGAASPRGSSHCGVRNGARASSLASRPRCGRSQPSWSWKIVSAQLFNVDVVDQAARVFDVPLVKLVRYERDSWIVLGGLGEGV